MKTTSWIFLLILAVSISCSKDKEDDTPFETGYLSLNLNVDMKINEFNSNLKSTCSTDDFMVIIYDLQGTEVLSFSHAADVPEKVELKSGEYYVISKSNNMEAAAFDAPYFYGRSENFTISASQIKAVDITCKIANCSVSIVYSNNIKTTFSDYFTEASSTNGKLIFSKDEVRKGYFELEPIKIKATLTYTVNSETKTKILTGTISSPEAGKHYEIVLDAKLTGGFSAFNIGIDNTEIKEQVSISEESGLLITEIMYNPDSIDDTQGEWFEVYNNSDEEIELNGLTIKRGPNSHKISTDVVLLPGEYYALARSEQAFEGAKYIYNSSFNLTNSNSTLSIYKIEGTDSTLIASVPYGMSGFPSASGASINLNPNHFNSNDAKLGSSWCLASVPYNTKDLGTPGLPNSFCD